MPNAFLYGLSSFMPDPAVDSEGGQVHFVDVPVHHHARVPAPEIPHTSSVH